MNRGYVIALIVVLAAWQAATGVALADAGAADAGVQDTVTVTVTVVDEGGSTVRDAAVTATWDGGEETVTTRSNGQALVDVPEGATVEFAVQHSNYVRNNPVVVQNIGEETVEITVFGRAEANVHVISEGQPVPDAEVVLFKRGRIAAEGRTAGDGVFQSGTIERGEYRVVVEKPGYYDHESTAEVTPDTDYTVQLEQGTVTVEFTVVDDHFEEARPVQGASVQIGEVATITTSSSGSAQVGLPVNSEFTVTVTKDGYERARRTLTTGEGESSARFVINREDALHIEALNERVVAGERVQLEVTDAYGDPVSGATVVVDGEDAGQTNAEGVYRAQLDAEGEHTISARASGVSSSEVTVEAIDEGGDATPASTPTPSPSAVSTATSSPTPGGSAIDELPTLGLPRAVMLAGVGALSVVLVIVAFRLIL